MLSDTTMSSRDTIIEANGLGKVYHIYDSPNARLKQALWGGRRRYYKEFWALNDVSFRVRKGESLGIIGRNGSGKSTLLQLVCGTVTPSQGVVSTEGRIAALLELGSGFNPEFTGLENIYLNASLLGLSKEETDYRLDKILAFADIGEFVGQPVKTYSSGMTVRLAFAVIAHVDADILVVDEALAVGDAVFVQRCMRFIRKMREERCLLFVSHDAEAVKSLCSHALWLSKGSVQAYGECKDVSLEYLRFCQATSYGEEAVLVAIGEKDCSSTKGQEATDSFAERPGSFSFLNSIDYDVTGSWRDNLADASGWKTGAADLLEINIRDVELEKDLDILRGGEEVEIIVKAKANMRLARPILGFVVKDRLGQSLFGENTLTTRTTKEPEQAEPGSVIIGRFRLWFPMLPAGSYTVLASIADGDLNNNIQHHWLDDAAVIRITSSRVRHGIVGAFFSQTDIVVENSG